MFKKTGIAIFVCTLMGANYSYAGDVSGTITFDKRPPLGGVIYVKQDATKSVDASIDQKDKVFTKKVMAGTPGGKAIFNNTDSHDHNIFANDIDYGVNFDVGLIPAGGKSEVTMDWKEDSLVRIGCKIHPKMKAYLANVNSDNFTILEFSRETLEYTFELSGVDQQDDKFVVKLPKYDDIEVTLKPGGSETFELMRKGKKKGTITLSRS